MKTLEFYDVKGKKKFKSNSYKLSKKKGKGKRVMHFAICKAPSGIDAYRIVGADFKG